ncbi:prolyl aminopeptidase [Inquilinus limosus]|uniref:prolyl aminopeptidase n=1 Tax=Inquilinus limosus TaxID=171674 RepID=UPI001E499A6E|nr:prolyl aminopeptidase [Inquilinus limosus]
MSDGGAIQADPAASRTHRLKVDDLHELHVEESGTPRGLPVVVLHGGPGAGLRPGSTRSFDPAAFRIVAFDQRGAGRSTPHAELAGNTTQALVADIERVRQALGIDRWLVAGGSWGSCLALAYGQAHPERCLGFRLHGIFLASRAEIDWWFQGCRVLFPDRWEDFAGFVPEEERGDLLTAYHRRLIGEDPKLRLAAAIRLRTFSAWTQTFLPDPEHVASLTEPKAALAVARIFTHYCVNGAFLAPGQLLRGLDRIRHLPAEIVQGRYDTVTPMETAWALHRAWPEARFTIVDEANHAATDRAPALTQALRAATDRLRDALASAAA